MPSIPGVLSISHGEKEGCNIEDTIACYEAIQFSYFEEEKMCGWIENGTGIVKASDYCGE